MVSRKSPGIRVSPPLPFGVLALLLKAKQQPEIEEVRSSLDALRQKAGFFLGDKLYRQILEEAGEAL